MYDNTKFENAFKAWLETRVDVGFGEHYAGDLLADFEDFLRESKMMKRSPGRVVFGKELLKHDFEKRKRLGLTFWSGLELKNKPQQDALDKVRYRKSRIAAEAAERRRLALQKENEKVAKAEVDEHDLEAFRKELEEETRDNIVSVAKDETT